MNRPATFALFLVVAGCGKPASTGNTANAIDPAVTAALSDPIMIDPQLDRRSNADALRPADQPYQALIPPGTPDPTRGDAAPTVIARVKNTVIGDRVVAFAGCEMAVRYGLGWANRLPAELVLPQGAQVSEAAGSESNTCRLRVVSFSQDANAATALDFYRAIGKRGGYALVETVERGGTVMTGIRARDGAAFMATVTPNGQGKSAIDLMVNRGQ